VLVLAGKREVTASFFIDQCTARHQLTDADFVSGTAEYLGVEAVWNHLNYYVNMQQSTSSVQVSTVSTLLIRVLTQPAIF